MPEMDKYFFSKFARKAQRLRYPRRLVNYVVSEVARRLKLSFAPALPSRIDIEPINTCNLKCPHCQVTYWNKEPRSLDQARFESILRQLPHLMTIKLQGMGEPFLNRDLMEMIRAGERRGIAMHLFTNGTVMGPGLAEQIAHLQRTHLCVSIDGATAQTHDNIRVGSSLPRIVAAIHDLVARRGPSRQPVITMYSVLTQANIHEAAGLVQLAHSLGVDGITLQTVLTGWGKKEIDQRNESLRLSEQGPELADALRAAQKEAQSSGVTLEVSTEDRYTRTHPCPWPWTSAYITAGGDVVPCCILADSETMRMGNVFSSDFRTIWNSRQYRSLREQIRKHDLPACCRGCYGNKPAHHEGDR